MKKTIRMALLVMVGVAFSSVAANAQYSDLILDAEPFAYWQFDDDEGEFIPLNSGTGDIFDALDPGDVSIEFGVDSIVPGGAGTAARFDGSAQSLISFPDDAQINTGGPFEEKTIEFWFSADDVNTASPQVMMEQGGATRGIAFYVQDGELFAGSWNRNNDDGGVSSPWENSVGDPQVAYASTPVQSNTPYHVAFVMDGDTEGKTGTITTYLDGGAFGELDGIGQLFNHGDDFGIGGMNQNIWLANGTNPGGDGLFFNGVLDEVAFYNVALDSSTILEHALLEPRDPPGDFDDDGDMDLQDFLILANNFGDTFGRDEAINKGDFNRDRTVDMRDFRDFRIAIAAQGASTVSAVPEPTGGVLGAIMITFGLTLRRRRS